MDIVNNAAGQSGISFVYKCKNCGELYPIPSIHICSNPKYPNNSSTAGA